MVDLLSNALGQMLGELLGEPIEAAFDRRALGRALDKAVRAAERRFADEYRAHDAELVDALVHQTRFADLPSVRAALRALITRPFHDTSAPIAVLRQSFDDVLPARTDRARVDAAVAAFLGYLGHEVLYIPQLRELYALVFQKTAADTSRQLAARADALALQLAQLLAAPPATALLAPAAPPERRRPWHNLPQRSYARFVGRQAELQQLQRLLLPHPRSRHFVVTLDGIGGVGKSALALELAHSYSDTYAQLPPDERFEAIVWVSAKRTLLTASGIQQRQPTFGTLHDLYREIATVLDQTAILQAEPAARRGLIERALAAQRTLLIVDNLETVDDDELLSFLRELPDPTKAIVTTRHRIDIAYALRLSGMPEADARALMQVEAARKHVALPPEAESDLYRRTGGLPLAIVWSIGLMSLGYGIDSVLRRLGSGQSDIARFCFSESVARIRHRDAYRLLLALALFEQRVDRALLGVVAGFSDDVIGRDDGLAELLQLSLINQKGERFFLLPLTQRYVLDELAARPAIERELRERWIEALAQIARQYGGVLWHYPDRRRLKQVGQHMLALATWAQREDKPAVLLQFVPALLIYFDMLGYWSEMHALALDGLEYARLTGDLPSVMLIESRLCWLMGVQGKYDQAEGYIADALKIARAGADAAWICYLELRYAQHMRNGGSLDLAAEHSRQALEQLAGIAEPQRSYARASIEHELGKIARQRADWPTAHAHFLAAWQIFGDENDPALNLEGAWGVLSNLGLVAQQQGDHEAAAQMYQQSLEICREIGGKGALTNLLVRLALLEQQRGNPAGARAHADEALEWATRLGMIWEQRQAAQVLEALGPAAA